MEKGQVPSGELGASMEKKGFFSQRAHYEFLNQTLLEAMVPDLPVLHTAYLIERDFAEYYANVAAQAEGPAKQVLEMLAMDNPSAFYTVLLEFFYLHIIKKK